MPFLPVSYVCIAPNSAMTGKEGRSILGGGGLPSNCYSVASGTLTPYPACTTT